MPMIFTKPTPGAPFISANDVPPDGFVRNLNHRPIGITAPPGQNPRGPTEWNKLAEFPSSQSINHGKAPVQR